MRRLIKFFGKKEYWEPLDLSFLKYDIHSHLIPGIDDGSKSMEESLQLIKGLKELGYQGAVTTPHIMSDFYRNTPQIITDGLATVHNEMQNYGIDFKLTCAAEYYMDFDFLEKLKVGPILNFGEKYSLVEFSFMQAPTNFSGFFFELQTSGYKPVLAHPERYAYWQNNFKQFSDLKDRDVLFQINLLSLTGYYGESVLKTAELLIENNMVEWLGTDLHNLHQLNLLKQFKVRKSIADKIMATPFLNSTLVL